MPVDLDIRLEELIKELKKRGARKVLILLPDGLKPFAAEIYDHLKRAGFDVWIWLESCYGPCDIPPVEGFDVVVNFGHEDMRNR